MYNLLFSNNLRLLTIMLCLLSILYSSRVNAASCLEIVKGSRLADSFLGETSYKITNKCDYNIKLFYKHTHGNEKSIIKTISILQGESIPLKFPIDDQHEIMYYKKDD